MTILLCHRLLVPLTGAKANSPNKIVIPTGAQRSGGTCGFFSSAGSVVADKGADRNSFVMTWQPAFVCSGSSPIFSMNYIAQPSSLPLIWNQTLLLQVVG